MNEKCSNKKNSPLTPSDLAQSHGDSNNGNNQSVIVERLHGEVGALEEKKITKSTGGDEWKGNYTPTVLVLGAMGVGKSSLINAILDMRAPSSAAPASSSLIGKQVGATVGGGGTACTPTFIVHGPTPRHRIRLIDSQGLERDNHVQQLEKVHEYLKRGKTGGSGVARVDIVFVMLGVRWEDGDISLVKSLLDQRVIVVVVIGKADSFEKLDPDINVRTREDGGNTEHGYQRMAHAVRRDFADIPIFVTADVDYARQEKATRSPLQCPNGHGREWFVESRVRGKWRCTRPVDSLEKEEQCECNATGNLNSGSFGVDAIRQGLSRAQRALARRGVLFDRRNIVTRVRKDVSRIVDDVFWKALKSGQGYTEEMCTHAQSLVQQIAEEYVASRLVTQILKDGHISRACTKLARSAHGPLGLFKRQNEESLSSAGGKGWRWPLVHTHGLAAVCAMSVQTVVMGCVLAIEFVLFEHEDSGTHDGIDREKMFVQKFSGFCEKSSVDHMGEVRSRFEQSKNAADTLANEALKTAAEEVLKELRACAWDRGGYS